MSKLPKESKFNGPAMNIRPNTPKSALMLKDRKTSRDVWANCQTQGYIRERGMIYPEQPRPDSSLETAKSRDNAQLTRKREAVASLQASFWPFSVNFLAAEGKISHKMPEIPHVPGEGVIRRTRKKSLALSGTSGSPSTMSDFRDEKQWRAPSISNQRYQYHVMFSRVNLKTEPTASEVDEYQRWNEESNSTGGAKTDSLLPGCSHTNGIRWAPVMVSHDLLTKTEAFRDGITAPSTGAEFIQAARTEKWEERERRERYRVHQHAKKQGVQDVDSWLMSVGHGRGTANTESRAFDDKQNRWNRQDKHIWLQVSTNGLSVRAGYKSIQDRNGMVRAERGFVTGRHYWTIILDSFDVVGQGWHVVGVAGADDSLESPPGGTAIGSGTGAGLFLEHCQKVRGGALPQAYGKRGVKAGDEIGVLLDLDLGELSFFLNGEDLGVAFYGMRGPLHPAVEMGMMVGQKHQYRADFTTEAPPRRRMEDPPISDEEAFQRIASILPRTSKKFNQQGFGSVLSVPNTMPHQAPGGINHRITSYPQVGDFLLSGSGAQHHAVAVNDAHFA